MDEAKIEALSADRRFAPARAPAPRLPATTVLSRTEEAPGVTSGLEDILRLMNDTDRRL